jgi:hypothetical protein
MKLQEGGCCVAGMPRDFAGVRSLSDAEQQTDDQIAPQQLGELLGKFGGTACEEFGRLGPGHDSTQGGAACLASYGIERTRSRLPTTWTIVLSTASFTDRLFTSWIALVFSGATKFERLG